MAVYDPNHFCPSWCKCCEENLALKPKPSLVRSHAGGKPNPGLTLMVDMNAPFPQIDGVDTLPPIQLPLQIQSPQYPKGCCMQCGEGPLAPLATLTDGSDICAKCR